MPPRYLLHASELEPGRVTEYRATVDGDTLSFARAIDAWQHDDDFFAAFDRCLAACAHDAVFFEMPPATRDRIDEPFRFVLVAAPTLSGLRADPSPFANRFRTARDGEMLVFENLGGDAVLVCPAPLPEPVDAAHLLAYVRSAPADRRRALWRSAGAAFARRLGSDPVWLSTSGLGVAWLHLRLDDRPKYYTWRPYAQYRSRW